MEPKLEKEYIRTGTLRLEWRDFPYLGRGSVDAALAARAAQAQGAFWEYHDLLYENGGDFSEEKLEGLAREAGLDAERFAADLSSKEYEPVVQADFGEAQERGVQGTPTFVINGKVLVGFQPVGVFEDAIEKAKREAEEGE